MRGCSSVGMQLRVKHQKPPVSLNSTTVDPVELLELIIVLNGFVVKCLFDTGAERCYISSNIYKE